MSSSTGEVAYFWSLRVGHQHPIAGRRENSDHSEKPCPREAEAPDEFHLPPLAREMIVRSLGPVRRLRPSRTVVAPPRSLDCRARVCSWSACTMAASQG